MGEFDRLPICKKGDIKMANKLLDYVNPMGRPPKYSSAEMLWQKFVDYTELMERTPIRMSMRSRSNGDKEVISNDSELRPHSWTLGGFCLYASITNWTTFKETKKYQTADFLRVIRAIEQSIVEHQISGASVGLYNPNLVARLNGLSESHEVTGKDGKDLIADNRSYEEKVAELNDIVEKLKKR